MNNVSLFLISLNVTSAISAGAANRNIESSHTPRELADTLPEVEVVANQNSKTLASSTPYHDINPEKIKTSGITDISDALKRLPGINLRDYGGAGGLKTVSVRGLGAQHTAVIYDGVPLSDVRSGEIDVSRYSLDNVRSIALSIGDNEDIFIPARSAAAAASLAIYSIKTPDIWLKNLELTAQMRVGSFGLYNPFFHIGKSNGSNFSIAASAEYIHSKNDYPFTIVNGIYKSRERRKNSKMDSGHAEINISWKPTNSSSLSTKLYYYDNNRQLPGLVNLYNTDSKEKLHDRNFFGQAQYRNKLSSKISLLSFAKFNWSASNYSDVNGAYPGGFLDQKYYQREAYISGALLYTPLANLAFDYSIDWFYNNLNSNLKTDSRPYRNSLLQTIAAKYSVWRFTAMARLLYSAYFNGAKDADAGKNADRLSPSFSLSLKPIDTAELYVRAHYKNIFRMPTFNELYFDNYGSLNVDPETTDQWNLGLTYKAPVTEWLTDLTVTADGYINNVNNKIVAIPYNLFRWTMTNLGVVRIFGLDVTLNSQIRINNEHSIVASGNYSYQRAQPRTSPDMNDWMKQLAYTPLNSGAASLSWLNPWVGVVVHSTSASAKYTTNNNLPKTKIAGYTEVGFALFRTFNFLGHAIELRADLINAFDKQYCIVAKYPMPGRSWQCSVKFDL